jgi:hypothetical protein
MKTVQLSSLSQIQQRGHLSSTVCIMMFLCDEPTSRTERELDGVGEGTRTSDVKSVMNENTYR